MDPGQVPGGIWEILTEIPGIPWEFQEAFRGHSMEEFRKKKHWIRFRKESLESLEWGPKGDQREDLGKHSWKDSENKTMEEFRKVS